MVGNRHLGVGVEMERGGVAVVVRHYHRRRRAIAASGGNSSGSDGGGRDDVHTQGWGEIKRALARQINKINNQSITMNNRYHRYSGSRCWLVGGGTGLHGTSS